MINFYELLGIRETSSKEEIKTAYKNMVKKYHPDVNRSEEANQIIRSLNEAKEILLDDEKRKEYDLSLQKIKYSKQFSDNKKETYKETTKEYKETYDEVYVTKWQFFINYWKNGLDKIMSKILKTLLVGINMLSFAIIKGLTYGIIFILYALSDFIDYLAGILIVFAFLSLFLLSGQNQSGKILFLSRDIEKFLALFLSAIGIEILKFGMIKGSLNLYVFFQNIEDKIFVRILMN